MIIDFHTHTFPDGLAERAVGRLAQSARIQNYLDGTTDALLRSMEEAGIAYSVLLPVVTKPEQQARINQLAIEQNAHSRETGLLSFGGIHPDNEDYRQILQNLAANKVKGIKLHPVFQRTNINDPRYLRIISCACEYNLIVLIHAGYDISYPEQTYSSVTNISSMLDTVKPQKIVLAHMGGWNCWDETKELLAGRDVWLDTSFCLLPLIPAAGTVRKIEENYHLSKEAFLQMVRKHGVHRILFGSDSPWGGQAQTIAALKQTGLTPDELDKILGRNAAALLQL
ncbi:MAG: amidohydrolase family protein [Candidatus Gastranaerophilales bacterium]|nr:amidohydrolase family protein [Candidatus Gastranaerophilales bacterium]